MAPVLVSVRGGGPAGASAAIAARREGSPVTLIEKSKFPRHKVCGEFFSPEIARELEDLGAWNAFMASGPARIRRLRLHFGTREKSCRLPEPGWGLSRHAFDALLFDRALEAGAQALPESTFPASILAVGRGAGEPRGQRLFGFKAHFDGPADDAVELFFFEHCYVGVNAVEGGRTNVCGLGPEDFLRRFEFEYDRVIAQSPALASRLKQLTRSMKWLTTGPLRFRQQFHDNAAEVYLAGDALSFVDPFTGSGLLAAVKTGALAGRAAARQTAVADYLSECRSSLKKPFEAASIFRQAVSSGWADRLAALIPGRLLFALTRPAK